MLETYLETTLRAAIQDSTGPRPCTSVALWLMCALAGLFAAAAGCVELDLHIRVNADESVVVTERVRFSDQVLDLASTLPAAEGLEVLLKKERAAERVKLMGEGCQLVSHTVRDVPGGARECVTVYTTPDLNTLRVCTPALMVRGHGRAGMNCKFYPEYRRAWNTVVGHMITRFHTPSPDQKSRRDAYWQSPPPAPSPAEMQKCRDLLPVFGDLMKDLKLTMVFEYWGPVRYGVVRERKSSTPRIYLIKYDETNLDQYGTRVLENEEFLLALIRWDLQSPHVVDVLSHSGNNLAVPVWDRGRGTSGQRQIAVRPSKGMFDKHYKGKPTWMGGDLDVPEPKPITREHLIKWGGIKEPKKPDEK